MKDSYKQLKEESKKKQTLIEQLRQEVQELDKKCESMAETTFASKIYEIVKSHNEGKAFLLSKDKDHSVYCYIRSVTLKEREEGSGRYALNCFTEMLSFFNKTEDVNISVSKNNKFGLEMEQLEMPFLFYDAKEIPVKRFLKIKEKCFNNPFGN